MLGLQHRRDEMIIAKQTYVGEPRRGEIIIYQHIYGNKSP